MVIEARGADSLEYTYRSNEGNARHSFMRWLDLDASGQADVEIVVHGRERDVLGTRDLIRRVAEGCAGRWRAGLSSGQRRADWRRDVAGGAGARVAAGAGRRGGFGVSLSLAEQPAGRARRRPVAAQSPSLPVDPVP